MPTIVLDPGHGGNDSGAAYRNTLEKDINLEVALIVRDYLKENYDVKIVMTRTKNIKVELPARTNLANKAKADYFCSLHVNAGGGTGWESYIYNGPVSKETVKAQRVIHEYVMGKIKKFGVRDRGMKRANFHVLRESNMPAILIENLFIDTNKDLKLLRDDSFLETLGLAIGEGLARALSLRRVKKEKDSPKDKEGKLYRVIAGSFASKENAEKQREMLKDNDIEAFVVKTTVKDATRYRVQAGAFRNRKLAEKRRDVIRALDTDAFITTEE